MISLEDPLAGVSRETRGRLERFAAMLAQWSARINLVGASTRDEIWSRHILDSAQLPALVPQARHWVDLGSGAGLPGMVIAILLGDVPRARVDLVESNRKKAAFLQTARAALAPAARVHADRIEAVLPTLPAPDVVTARALAPLPRLLDMTAPWLAGETIGLFHKGRGYADELAESRALWPFDLVEHDSVVSPDSRILEISRLRDASDAR